MKVPRLTSAQLAVATDEEIDTYLAALEAAAASQPDDGWEPQPRQATAERFLENLEPGKFHELLYGGAAGGGKSEWLLMHQYRLALRYPGFSGLILRRTFPELRRSLIGRSLERFDQSQARYLRAEKVWEFNNGSRIEFGYLESDFDVYRYQSAEYACVAFDELTQWPTDVAWTYLMSRLRVRGSLMSAGLVPHIIGGTNPGGVGGAWVKARFIDVGPPEVRTDHVMPNGSVSTRVFVPARLEDNRYIDADAYRAALGNLPEQIRKALEHGSWDVIEGQYFTEWDRTVHVVEPFEIPSWWVRFRGLDYGYTNPFCCLWVARDGDGDLWVYREVYETGLTPEQQARLILSRTGRDEQVLYTAADPSIWASTGVGAQIATQYVQAGLSCRKALNARVDGWARVREYLRVDPERADDQNPQGKPRLRVFSTCENLIRTLPMLVHDRYRPEDLDSEGEDHAADALRYALMSFPPQSRPPRREPTTVEERIAERRRRRWRDAQVEHPILGTGW